MNWNEHHTKLKTILAEKIPDKEDSKQYVEMAGIPLGNIAFTAAANTNWYKIIKEAMAQEKVVDLIDAVLPAYPLQGLKEVKAALSGTNVQVPGQDKSGLDIVGLKQEVRELIQQGRIKKALNFLTEQVNQVDSEIQTTIIALSAQHAQLRLKEIQGAISQKNFTLENNQIGVSILNLLNEL